MRKLSRHLLVGIVLTVLVGNAAPAIALPSTSAATTWQVNGTVRTILKVGPNLWVGGRFTELLDPNGNPKIPVDNLAVLSALTGSPVTGLNPQHVTGLGAIVMKLATDGTNVYVAGKFTAVDGQARNNLAAIDAVTGTPTPTVFQGRMPNTLQSVAATTTRVYAGGPKLFSWFPNGQRDPNFRPVIASVDPTLRSHVAAPAFREIAVVGQDLMVAGAFDYLNGTWAKVVAKISAINGDVDWSWRPSNLTQTSTAFGISLTVDAARNAVFVAAGGSDFTAAYHLDTGALYWTEDTSGSSQAVQLYPADGHLIVGGHFQWVADNRWEQCGRNNLPNPNCWNQPRLVALSSSLDPATGGLPDKTWRPTVCCKYPGVWALLVVGSAIHVGGAFTTVGGQPHDYYARLG